MNDCHLSNSWVSWRTAKIIYCICHFQNNHKKTLFKLYLYKKKIHCNYFPLCICKAMRFCSVSNRLVHLVKKNIIIITSILRSCSRFCGCREIARARLDVQSVLQSTAVRKRTSLPQSATAKALWRGEQRWFNSSCGALTETHLDVVVRVGLAAEAEAQEDAAAAQQEDSKQYVDQGGGPEGIQVEGLITVHFWV